MFKAQEVIKKDDCSTITFTDGLEAYGALIVGEEPLYIEFMKFDKKGELLIITENGTPEEYNKLKEKYLEDIMKSFK